MTCVERWPFTIVVALSKGQLDSFESLPLVKKTLGWPPMWMGKNPAIAPPSVWRYTKGAMGRGEWGKREQDIRRRRWRRCSCSRPVLTFLMACVVSRATALLVPLSSASTLAQCCEEPLVQGWRRRGMRCVVVLPIRMATHLGSNSASAALAAKKTVERRMLHWSNNNNNNKIKDIGLLQSYSSFR